MNLTFPSALKREAKELARPALRPDRGWFVLLGASVLLLVLFAIRGVFAYLSVQAEETPVPVGAESVLSSDEFSPVFARYNQKQKMFDERLSVPLVLPDPAGR